MYLVGGPVLVGTDHAALKWFNTQPKLTQRQARWSIAMQEQDVTFIHLPGQANVIADALSRRPDLEANATQLRKRKQNGTLLESETLPQSPWPLSLMRTRTSRQCTH
jgi:hypothetical protein